MSFLQAGHTGASVGIFKDDAYMHAPSFFQLEGVVREVVSPWQTMQDTCVSCVSVECLLVLSSAVAVILFSNHVSTIYMNIHSVLPQSMKIHLRRTSKAAAGNFVHARRVI